MRLEVSTVQPAGGDRRPHIITLSQVGKSQRHSPSLTRRRRGGREAIEQSETAARPEGDAGRAMQRRAGGGPPVALARAQPPSPLPVARLGGDRAGRGGGRGVLRRLRMRWLTARWLRRAARRLAAIYLAALAGPPTGASSSSSSTCPPWIGVEPCFATPFVISTRPCW